MLMENVKYSRVLEITSNYIKFAVGYVSNNVPHLVYYKKIPITGLVSDGRIINREKLIKALAEIHNIDDSTFDVKMDPNAVSLVLPSLGVKTYESTKASAIVGGESNLKVTPVDVTNVFNLLKTGKVEEGSMIVDVVPCYYVIKKPDGGDPVGFSEPPIGTVANSLSIKAKIYSLPIDILNNFTQVVQEAGFRVLKRSVSVYCASQLIGSDVKYPKTYVLIDLGADLVTISPVNNGEAYSSYFINGCGRALSDKIAKSFDIPFQIANDLKEKFGYDVTSHRYETPLYVGVNNENEKIKIYQKDLNGVITSYFERLLTSIKLNLDQLNLSEGQKYGQIPVVVTGGTSRLRGLSELLKPIFGNRQLYTFVPNVIGARDAGATNLLGMMIAETKQKRMAGPIENYQGITNLSREK